MDGSLATSLPLLGDSNRVVTSLPSVEPDDDDADVATAAAGSAEIAAAAGVGFVSAAGSGKNSNSRGTFNLHSGFWSQLSKTTRYFFVPAE
jgi:hypothetical protein